MSAISEQVRIGLFTKLNVSGVTTVATGGVHHKLAPEGTARPYVIFQRQAPGAVTYSFGTTAAPNLALEDDLWLIKSVTDEDSSASLEPEALAEQILTACEAAIGNSLTLSSNTAVAVYRQADIASYAEKLSDRMIHHHGFLLRVVSR